MNNNLNPNKKVTDNFVDKLMSFGNLNWKNNIVAFVPEDNMIRWLKCPSV